MPTPKEILKTYFNHNDFHLNQEQAINTILKNEDVLILMPTGGGKSICYQIPALILNGTAIIISPLISLMKDQVDSLKSKKIKADFLNSTVPYEKRLEITNNLKTNNLDLLYLSPEKLFWNNNKFLGFLKTINISLFAIDEAHCISQWGYDFRPEYLKLSLLKKYFPSVPTIAVTATADEYTRKDIIEKLSIKNSKIFVSGFNRKNIYYYIQPVSDKHDIYKKIANYLRKHRNDSGIIYTFTRSEATILADTLSQIGFSAKPYHAALLRDVRDKNQRAFMNGEVKIIVATIAFGMGINKPNIRFVLHTSIPRNIENYYQETGRAGRDGLKSEVILFYNKWRANDKKKFIISNIKDPEKKEIEIKKLEKMIEFCKIRTCRRKFLLECFGESISDHCEKCDICINRNKGIIPKIYQTLSRKSVI
ncbi:MAG: RecQ family ATP-dependent DNA helicase [Candidatus Zapsychrus exili]|nr:RecQ family ATP-dependent DNA helicase [Candidatus Zapsychrus exili]